MRYLQKFGVIILAAVTFLAGCTSEATREETADLVLTLTIQAGSQISLDGKYVDLSDLKSVLRTESQKRSTYVIYNIAPDAPAGTFHEVVRQVNESGVAGVSFADADGAGAFYPPVLPAR